MIQANRDIRKLAEENNIYLWQIANEIGILDTNFSKKLRSELPENEKKRIIKIIKKLAERRE